MTTAPQIRSQSDAGSEAHMTNRGYDFYDAGVRQVSDAMALGKHQRKGAITHELDYSGRCSRPITVERKFRPDDISRAVDFDKAVSVPTLYTDTLIACRNCEACLKARTTLWRRRAVTEYKLAPRTWFGTLTVAPHLRSQHLYLTGERLAAREVDFDGLNEERKFAERCRTLHTSLRLAFKRVRNNAKTSFRYCAVFERHSDGEPHAHLLLHEILTRNPVTKRQLDDAWHDGFSQWRLAKSPAVCGYMMKYITKSKGTRIRASFRYGDVADREATPVNQPPQ